MRKIITGNYEKNYHRKLWGENITVNYEDKLSQEIMRRNYHRKLSASLSISSRKKCGNYRDTGVSKN